MEDYMRIVKLTDETKNNILEDLLKRSPNSYGKFEAAVNDIPVSYTHLTLPTIA